MEEEWWKERYVYLFERDLRRVCEKAAVIASKPYKNITSDGVIIEHYKNHCYERVIYPNGELQHQYIEDIKGLFIPLVSNFVYLWRRLGGIDDSKESFYLLRSWTDALVKYFTKYHTFYKLIDLLGTEYNSPVLSFEERCILKQQLKCAMEHWFDTYKNGINLDDYDGDFGIEKLY